MHTSNAAATDSVAALKKTRFWTRGRIVVYGTLAVFAALVLFPAECPTIHLGMSHLEVLAAVRRAPGNYAEFPNNYIHMPEASQFPVKPPKRILLWTFDHGALIVYFDENDLVVGNMTYKAERRITPMHRIVHLLGWTQQIRE